jgi:hypothetical protein
MASARAIAPKLQLILLRPANQLPLGSAGFDNPSLQSLHPTKGNMTVCQENNSFHVKIYKNRGDWKYCSKEYVNR